MIEAKDLRIGNKFSGAGMIQTVKAIETYNPDQKGYEHLILVEENRNQYKPVDMEPIPLTPDILLAFGFKNFPRPDYDAKKMIDLFYLRTGYVQITFHMGETWLVAEDTDSAKSGQVILNKSVRAVHQLQNLHFALTGLEISYKPV